MSLTPAGDLRAFPSTNWSNVGRAGNAGLEGHRQAMESLLRCYLPALRAHLRLRKRIAPDRIEDLLQGFVADKVVEQNLIASASRAKGKFRSFLLIALGRYVIDQIRHDKARCRAPAECTSVNLVQADYELAAPEEPSEQFSIAWARQMIAEALRRMQKHCEQYGRTDIWTVFYARIVSPALEGAEPMPYEQLARELRLEAVLYACNLLTTAKRMFARCLQSVAAEYVEEGTEVEEEIMDLRRIIAGGRAEGWKKLRN